MRNYYKKLKKGFTLVELVVVIAVIAILAAVSVGAYFGITDSANSSNATTSLKQVKDYWTMYSVSDYDSSKTLSETGDDFAIRYLIEYNGYTSTYVNYAEFTVDNATSPQQGGVEEKGLIFKVETDYPTYFILKGNRIIEESKTPSKTEEEFFAAIDESSLVKEEASALDFKLSTIIFNDNEVRGHRYIKYDIDSFKGSEATGSETVYVLNGASVSGTVESYRPSTFKTANNTEVNMFNLTENDEVFAHDEERTSESFESNEKIESDYYLYSNIKYGYVVESHELKRVYSTEIPSIEQYPIIIYNANTSYYNFYSSFAEINYTIPANTGNKQNTILLGDVTLDKSLIIPSGYNVIVDFLNDVTSMQKMTSENGYFVMNDVTGGVSDSNTRLIHGGNIGTTFLGTEQIKVVDGKYTYVPLNEKKLVNKFVIADDVTLTVSSNSNLAVEAQIGYTGGGVGSGINNFSQIENNGTIIFETGSNMKSIGKITGSGSINMKADTTLYDLFKINSFTGGTKMLSKALYITGGTKVYPILDYQFDNIQCTVNFYNKAKYNFITVLNTGGDTYSQRIVFFDSSNAFMINTTPDSNNDIVITKQFIYNTSDRLMYFNKFIYRSGSSFVFGSISMNLKIGDWYSGTLHSKDFNFPLCHLDLSIEQNATLTLGKFGSNPLTFEIMPSSRIVNNGNFVVKDGAQLAICSFGTEDFDIFKNGFSYTCTEPMDFFGKKYHGGCDCGGSSPKCDQPIITIFGYELHGGCKCYTLEKADDGFMPAYNAIEKSYGSSISTSLLFTNNGNLTGSLTTDGYRYKYYSNASKPGDYVVVDVIK